MNLHNIQLPAVWRNAGGGIRPVADLGDDHLINIMDMFREYPRATTHRSQERQEQITAVYAEARRRGII